MQFICELFLEKYWKIPISKSAERFSYKIFELELWICERIFFVFLIYKLTVFIVDLSSLRNRSIA